MTFLFSLVLLIVIGAVVVTAGLEGMLSAAITLINVLVSALIATCFFEPLAAYAQATTGGGQFHWDSFFLLSIFAVSVFILRSIADYLAPAPVEFPKLIDRLGGLGFSLWAGWLLVCFLCMVLQTAPLARNFFFEGFRPNEQYFLGVLGPDQYWLGFSQRMSSGPLAPLLADPADPQESHVFDPRGEFIMKYASQRERYASPDFVKAGY